MLESIYAKVITGFIKNAIVIMASTAQVFHVSNKFNQNQINIDGIQNKIIQSKIENLDKQPDKKRRIPSAFIVKNKQGDYALSFGTKTSILARDRVSLDSPQLPATTPKTKLALAKNIALKKINHKNMIKLKGKIKRPQRQKSSSNSNKGQLLTINETLRPLPLKNIINAIVQSNKVNALAKALSSQRRPSNNTASTSGTGTSNSNPSSANEDESELINTAPTANDDAFSINMNTALIINIDNQILINDSDSDGDVLTLYEVDSTSQESPQGTIVNNNDGTITYTPGSGFTGADSFEYTISDGVDTQSAIVTVDVSNPSLRPVISELASGDAINGNSVSTTTALTANDDELYIAYISYLDDTNFVTSVSGLGLTWNQFAEQCSNQGTNKTELWYAQGSVGVDSIINASLSASSDSVLVNVIRVSNVHSSSPFGDDNSANNLGSGSAAACGVMGIFSSSINYSLNSTVSNSLIISGITFINGASFTEIGSIETVENSVGSNPNIINFALQKKASSSVTTHNIDGTLSIPSRWTTIALEVLPP